MNEDVEKAARKVLPPPPQVLALNVCDYIWRDPWSGKATLIGMFSVVQAWKFPASHPIITIHAALTNGHGTVTLKLRLVDTDEERVPLIDFEAQVEFPDPRAVMDFQSGATGIVFPVAGEYRVQLWANGELLSERRILVIDASESKMNKTIPISTGIGGRYLAGKVNVTPIPNIPTTCGTGVFEFERVKKWLSSKPLRIRIADDAWADREVKRLAEQWQNNRPRGGDLEEMVGAPDYQAIIKIGHRAVRPLLLLLRKNPDHWFYALNQITGQNPVSPEAEGKVVKMTDAWIAWGKENGYLGELD